MRERIEQALQAAGVPLGTYTLPESHEKTPAIYMGDPPEGTTVEGLECLIALNPKRESPLAFVNPGAILAYLVRFVNNADEPDVLERATNALAEAFWPFWDEPAYQPATADHPEQVDMSLLYDPTQFPQEE